MKITVIVPVYNNERFVLDALKSVDEQGIDDLELIVVNDGSSDRSEEVISEFVREHPYAIKITQENQGVSAARNAALDIATGEFVGFLDSDDVYRPDALKNMIFVAEENKADLVIGESKSVGTFEDSVLRQARNLSQKTYISKDDTDLVYNFSVCNKLFRRDLIEKNHIRFQPVKHAEDGLFLFTYIDHCDIISGCPRYVYEYRKRVALDSQSALKSLNESMLDSVLEAIDSIGDIIRKISDELWREYLVRVFRVTLLDEYYRRLWTLDDKAFEKLLANLEKYKSMLDEESWEQVLYWSQDIEIENGFKTRREIAEAPVISVIIPYGLKATDYSNVLYTLYYQLCPDFEVVSDERYREVTDEEYVIRDNFHFCPASDNDWSSLLEKSRGKMINIVDIPCIYGDRTLVRASNRLKNAGAEFVSCIVRGYENGEAFLFKSIEEVFEQEKSIDNPTRQKRNETDCFWMNKLFNRDAVGRVFAYCKEHDPGSDPRSYVATAYKMLVYKRYKSNFIGAPIECFDLSKEEVISKSEAVDEQKTQKKGTATNSILWMFYFICRLFVPVNRNKVLFLSDIRDSIGGNYEPLYKELEQRGYDIICDFKASKKAKEGRRKKLQRMYDLATARFIVLEDFHVYTEKLSIRRNQDLVQLWHAAGAFKKFAWSRATGSEALNISPGYKKTTKAIVSAEDIRVNYAEAFNIDISKVFATGLPRTDIFFNEEYKKNIRDIYDERYPVLKGKKILLFCPTYRGTTLGEADYAFSLIEPERLLEAMGEDSVVIFKWHPALTTALKKKKKVPYDYSQYKGRVLDLSDERDINNLLMIADVCITDYSSVIFEYELMEKPMIYFWYDANDYRMGRGVYYDLDEYVYGRVAYDFDELLEAIRDKDLCKERRAEFHRKFMSACDGNATKRVADVIFKK